MIHTLVERLGEQITAGRCLEVNQPRTVEELDYPSLLNGEAWDRYNLESLLPLKEMNRDTTKFGFTVRHYWIPATILTFRQSMRTTFSDGGVERCELLIERQMARCRANECLWREKVFSTGVLGGHYSEPSILSEALCSYDCYNQTFVSAEPILFSPLLPEHQLEARRQALYRLPFLCPPGPVPVGYSWHAKVDDDYMNYRLADVKHIGDTAVLVIRRDGRFTVWLPKERTALGKPQDRSPLVIGRNGVTIFAWNRATVLEDRVLDRTAMVEGFSFLAGATSESVTRLIRSCPESLAHTEKFSEQRRDADRCNTRRYGTVDCRESQ